MNTLKAISLAELIEKTDAVVLTDAKKSEKRSLQRCLTSHQGRRATRASKGMFAGWRFWSWHKQENLTKGETFGRMARTALERLWRAYYYFLLWLVSAVERFPRSQKFLLGDCIQATALDVLERLITGSCNNNGLRVVPTALAANGGSELKLRWSGLDKIRRSQT